MELGVHSPTVSKYNPDSERRLGEMGLGGVPPHVQDASPQPKGALSLIAKMLGYGSTESQDTAPETVSTSRSEDSQLQQQLIQSQSDNQELRREVGEKGQENTRLLQQLAHASDQDTENKHQIARLHLNHDHNRRQRSMCTVLECLLVKW